MSPVYRNALLEGYETEDQAILGFEGLDRQGLDSHSWGSWIPRISDQHRHFSMSFKDGHPAWSAGGQETIFNSTSRLSDASDRRPLFQPDLMPIYQERPTQAF